MKTHHYPSPYGASMGRRTYGHDYSGKLYVSRVTLDSGGYDPGWAYFGLGERLYAASDTKVGDTPESLAFAVSRAKNRQEAVALFASIFPNAQFHRK